MSAETKPEATVPQSGLLEFPAELRLEKPTIEYKEALDIMDRLALVTQRAGEDILKFTDQIKDTGSVHHHESSTIDDFAWSKVVSHLDMILHDIEGRLFDSRLLEDPLEAAPELDDSWSFANLMDVIGVKWERYWLA